MDSLPSIPSEASVLPEGCQQLGGLGARTLDAAALRPWTSNDQPLDLLLVLAATQTAEHEGEQSIARYQHLKDPACTALRSK